VLLAGGALTSGLGSTWLEKNYLPGDPADRDQVILGAALYGRDCARCHGEDMGGELGWAREEAGLTDEEIKQVAEQIGDVAPAHDEHGSTSRIPDDVLFRIIDEGPGKVMKKPDSRMSGFHERLAEDEIWAIIAFMKDNWIKAETASSVN
jgi:mono/diheme cytochrome c family protein